MKNDIVSMMKYFQFTNAKDDKVFQLVHTLHHFVLDKISISLLERISFYKLAYFISEQ